MGVPGYQQMPEGGGGDERVFFFLWQTDLNKIISVNAVIYFLFP